MTLVAVVTLATSGCAVGPDARRPEMALPQSFTQGGVEWTRAQPDDAAPRGAWWAGFGDPQLDALMTALDTANLDLRVSEARFRQAEAVAQQARAGRWPTLDANASATRTSGGTTRFSSAGSSAALGTIGSSSGPSTSYSVAGTIGWEVDLWGRLARGVEANDASTQASAADLANTRLSLQASLAQNYISLRVAEAQEALLGSAVQAYDRSLTLTRNRYEAGVASRIDLTQAQTQLETTRAQLIDAGLQRAQLSNAIAVLVGQPASTFAVPPRERAVPVPMPGQLPASTTTPIQARPVSPPGSSVTPAPNASSPSTPAPTSTTSPASPAGDATTAAPSSADRRTQASNAELLALDAATLPRLPTVAPSLPATLLQRRPDVAAAERRAAAANAQIGVAQSAYFPALTLSATGGQRNLRLADLFEAASRVWSIGPSLALTLFDGGVRTAIKAQAVANWDAAAATYRRTVLGALQEVEDALVALRLLELEANAQALAVDAAEQNLQLALNQYRAGTVSFLNVITAQTAAVSSRRTQLDLRGRQLTNTVQLVRALGGGWSGALPTSSAQAGG